MEKDGLNANVIDDNASKAAWERCKGKTCWILTDGKAGDVAPCLGLAEALNLRILQRIVRPRAFFAILAPHGPIDWAEHPAQPGSPIRPPFPDFLFASGRRTAPYLSAVRRLSAHTYTVFLKNPRRLPEFAHCIWAPVHDNLCGPNIVTTVTAPHIMSPQRLAYARKNPDRRLTTLPEQPIAILLGGDSRHYRFTPKFSAEIMDIVSALIADGACVMITPSRRTPPALIDQLAVLQRKNPARIFLWDGKEENPYTAMLALAKAIIVTADSTNMVGEAVSSSVPVMVCEPEGGALRLKTFLDTLEQSGAIRRWRGAIETWNRHPLDATPAIAGAVAQRYSDWLREFDN